MTKSVSTPARVIVADVATQFRLRNGGSGSAGSSAYIQATRALAAWARADEANKALVHALVHLGWCSTSGARAVAKAASSAAFKGSGDNIVIGKDAPSAAEQVTRVLEALAEAGAPTEQVETVWATFTATA